SAPGSSSEPLHNHYELPLQEGRLRHQFSMCSRFSAVTKAWHVCGTRPPCKLLISGKCHSSCLHSRQARHCGLSCSAHMNGIRTKRPEFPTPIRRHAFRSVRLRTARGQLEGSTMDAKTNAKNKSGTLTVGNNNWDMPIYSGTIGPDVVDISKLYTQSGMFTYDPGFTSTASCESKITYIDGDEGILLYRGYPIEQLAEHGDFLETCYLLLYGELPTSAQKADFDYRVSRH